MTYRHVARVRSIVVALALGLPFALPSAGRAQFTEAPAPAAYALTNVTVVSADGSQAAGQTVVIRNGRIEALGASGAVVVPADARVLAGDTLYIYPGLIDGAGTVRHEFPRDTVDRSQLRSWDPPRLTQGFTPSRRVADVLQATGRDVADLRRKGIVAVAVHPPATDPLMAGRGALLVLRPAAATPAQLLVRPELAPLMTLRGGRGVYPSTGMGVITWYRQTFLDAQRRLQVAQAANGDAAVAPAYDPDYDVVENVLRARGRVYFAASSADEIRRVLRLAEEFRLQPVILGGMEAWKVATELRAANVPVLVSVDFQRPRRWNPDEQVKDGEEPKELEPAAWREKQQLEDAYANAGRLAEAGVTFALVTGGRGDLRDGVRKAIEYGLGEADALRALTATPAALYGIGGMSRIERGASATFMVTDRPLFEKDTRVLYTFVEGALERGAEARRPAGAAAEGAGAADSAAAVNVAGTWTLEVQGQTSTMRLTQEGTELKGTLESDQGSMPVTGSMEGDRITLTGMLGMGGQEIPLTFTGVVTGDSASGTVSTPMGSMDWSARRTPGGAR
jgi:imidazolonepropionase-like amidohydrolase